MEKELRTEMSLNGEWTISWEDIGKGALEKARTTEGIRGIVPGDVHMALVDAGLIEDPAIGLNSQKCRWVEEKEFWYRKKFDVEADFMKDKTVITFHGLDLTSDIWLNGSFLGRHNNAFVEVEYDITNILRQGENEVVVRIDQGLAAVKDKPMERMDLMWNNKQPYRVWMRKPQYVYGWDWTIWLPSCGIWRDVIIESYENAYIKDAFVYTEFIDEKLEEGDTVKVVIDTEIERINPNMSSYTVECMVEGDERFEKCNPVIYRESKVIEGSTIQFKTEINNSRLWWPHLSGDPYLYHITILLRDKEGRLCQEIRRTHGIRKVAIREEKLNEKEQGFTFMINDTPIFCKGANHVPMDCLPGRQTEVRKAQLLQMAVACNMNMIRIWGGGVYESNDFMERCDELGLMVWHDFMYACGYYPDHDSEFFDEITRETKLVLKRMRRHTSLMGWSGNNEIQEMYISKKGGMPDLPWYGGKIYEELLPGLLNAMCKNVIYRESSPFGPKDNPSGFDIGDQHIWHFTHRPNFEHYMDLWRYTDFNLKFLSEFGIIGAMNLESARKCISADQLNPDSEEWLFHSNSSSDHQMLNMVVDKYFGDHKQFSLQEYILRSQVIQAEIVRHIYDEFRRRKFVCSGLLFWTLGDSIGLHNWAIMDYYLGKRPVYYYLQRSMDNLAIAFEGYEVQNSEGIANYRKYFEEEPKEIKIWVVNDYLQEKELILNYWIMTMDGEVLKYETGKKSVPANVSECIGLVSVSDLSFDPEKSFLYVEVESDEIIRSNRYFFAPYSKLQLEAAVVEYSVKTIDNDTTEITLSTDHFIWMLHLEAIEGTEYSDNDFDLLPGRKKIVICKGEMDQKTELVISGLNKGINVVYK